MNNSTNSGFSFESDSIDLPPGAWAKAHRRTLRRNGRELLAVTQGALRSYLYPVYTPKGFAVTTESPADHPHHDSVWVASDHVHALVDVGGGRHEEYTYNFYVNDVFQGRAPGRIVETSIMGHAIGADVFRIEQNLEWRGPVEWAAAAGRVIARETRTTDIRVADSHHLIDIRSNFAPAQWDILLAATRHSYFNVRVAESMRVTHGGRLIDADGHEGGDTITAATAPWVDYSGPVGGGHVAGITMVAREGFGDKAWFATDWGMVTLQPFRREGRRIRHGESLDLSARLIVHDGPAPADINRLASAPAIADAT